MSGKDGSPAPEDDTPPPHLVESIIHAVKMHCPPARVEELTAPAALEGLSEKVRGR